MAVPKEKQSGRIAGKRKFELPPREERVVSDNPVRDLLRSLNPENAPIEPITHLPVEALPTAIIETRSPAVLPSAKQKKLPAPKAKAAKERSRTAQLVIGQDASFALFKQKYGQLLGEARSAICEAIYNLSYGLGQSECFYSASKLAEATGFSDRYIFKLVGQLEALGFIEKVEIFNTATKKGTTFRLHLEPIIKPAHT